MSCWFLRWYHKRLIGSWRRYDSRPPINSTSRSARERGFSKLSGDHTADLYNHPHLYSTWIFLFVCNSTPLFAWFIDRRCHFLESRQKNTYHVASQALGDIYIVGRHSIPMLSSWPAAFIVSTLLGILAGLGVGGGSLLILWLTLIIDTPYPEARITNLLFFLPGAIIATLLRAKEKAISLKQIWPSIVAGCIGAAVVTIVFKNIELSMLRKLFGGLLLFTGIRELLYRPRNAK